MAKQYIKQLNGYITKDEEARNDIKALNHLKLQYLHQQ